MFSLIVTFAFIFLLVARYQREREGDPWVRRARFRHESSNRRFRDRRGRTQAPATVDGGWSLPPTPLFSDPRAKNVRNTAGNVALRTRDSQLDLRHSAREDFIDPIFAGRYMYSDMIFEDEFMQNFRDYCPIVKIPSFDGSFHFEEEFLEWIDRIYEFFEFVDVELAKASALSC